MSRRLKVGYVMQADSVDMAEVSGPQLHVKAVIEGLKTRGHNVRLVAIQQGRTVTTWTDDLTEWHPARFTISKSRWFRIPESAVRGVQSRLRLPFLRLFESYRFSDACVSALEGYDVLYERFGFLSYGGLIAAKRLSIPIVFELNGDLVEEFEEVGLRLCRAQWAIIHLITRQMLKRAGCVVAVSETLRQRIIDRWQVDPAKVLVVPNGAHCDLFASPQKPEDTPVGYGVNGGPSVVFVGAFQPWHGIDVLVEAFGQVAARDAIANLVLVGDGPVRGETERRVEELHLRQRVVFTGRVTHPEVAALLDASDIAVVNPKTSAMAQSLSPLKLFEYMAAGKAIVAPCIPELERFLRNRVNAILVPPNDVEALAGAISELLTDGQLRVRLGAAARRQALAEHSWDNTVTRLEAIMDGLVPA